MIFTGLCIGFTWSYVPAFRNLHDVLNNLYVSPEMFTCFLQDFSKHANG